jgi:cytidine deaminase
VGAAVLTREGRTFAGCNVENATYGATVCAERHAVSAAVLAGDHDIVAVVVYVGIDEPALPCGICRQVLAEFGDRIDVLSVAASGDERRSTIDELLPGRFRGEDIDRPRVHTSDAS